MSKPSKQKSLRTVLAASMTGSTLEWYDYIIFGNAAALVFPKLFFPNDSPVVGLLSSFATFAVGFVARPVGAVIAGHFGDRIGRRKVLLATLLIMGAGTVGIGLLPTYAQVGWLAPALLVLLRVVQGLALGGEWGGSVLLAVEQMSGGRRKGFLGSFPQAGDALGGMLSAGVFAALTTMLDDDAFLSWGWRVPFLLSAVVVVVGLWLRLLLDETPEFVEKMEHAAPERTPLVTVLRTMPGTFVLSMGCRLGVDIGFYIFSVFSLTYVTSRGLFSTGEVLVAIMAASALSVVPMVLFGALADRVGARVVSVCGVLMIGVMAFAFFPMVDTGSTAMLWLAILLARAGGAAAWAPYAGLLANVFPVRVRFTGTSFSFQFAGIFGGGIAPYVATALFHHFDSSLPVSVYAGVAVVISVICLLMVKQQNSGESSEKKLQLTESA
ncbi:MFS transporter [Streptomyces violaceusniger]|uniref:MFS transporter n=1 Tax=Streptomyces violaceusniger TaxID=68280 RepID=UPI000995E1C2|nr:MFS transporter [Streptomyces hygroscopicus]AQW46606.1 putative major facilitator superfamily transporter [Streptomyces hygroscopicus]